MCLHHALPAWFRQARVRRNHKHSNRANISYLQTKSPLAAPLGPVLRSSRRRDPPDRRHLVARCPYLLPALFDLRSIWVIFEGRSGRSPICGFTGSPQESAHSHLDLHSGSRRATVAVGGRPPSRVHIWDWAIGSRCTLSMGCLSALSACMRLLLLVSTVSRWSCEWVKS